MKIGILTYHRSHNYGAFIQAYALASAIKETLGCNVEIIDYNSPASEKFYKREIFRDKTPASVLYNLKKYKMFKREVHNLPISMEMLISNDLKAFREYIGNRYDVIVAGSDEIWKLDGERGFPNAYWLPEIQDCIKMSYAASSRNDVEKVSEEQKNQIRDLLNSFSFVGVRDAVTKNLIDSTVTDKATLVCDPTMAYNFTFDREKGKQLLREKFHVDTSKRCVGIMVNKRKLANDIRNFQKDDTEFVSLFYGYKGFKCCPELTPFEWVQVISSLDGLVTTFFHGMCIAINANVPFLIIEERNIKDKMYSKSYDLLSRHGMESHYLQANADDSIPEKIRAFLKQVSDDTAEHDFMQMKAEEQATFAVFCEALKRKGF